MNAISQSTAVSMHPRRAVHRLMWPAILIILAMMFAGCPPAKETTKVEPKPKPVEKKPADAAFEMSVASINLARYSKRIEQEDIRQFADLLRKEKIDILTVGGLSRYPGVESRIDFVDELSRDASMYNVFGETINVSGRQGGNAVFSLFPVRSSENAHYDNIASTNFEASLQVIIDCGVRDVVVVSTMFPEKASIDDVNTCANALGQIPIMYVGHPVIIGGNLPASDAVRSIAGFDATRPVNQEYAPRLWFSRDGSVLWKKQNVIHSALGTLIVATFELPKKVP